MTPPAGAGAPWYRHFWPWFIIGLLGSAVVASLVTVYIAVSGRDSLVSDDWYRSGMAINRRIELEERAGVLGIAATGRVDFVTGEVSLELDGDTTGEVSSVVLELSHPTRADRDVRVTLQRGEDGGYRGSLQEPPRGRRFYGRLEPGGESPGWRISGALELSDRRDFRLEPGV